MRITFRQLDLFVAIAKRENITQAANAIHLSQPAASMTLAELEAQLKHPLFDRVGKKLILNANGKKLLPKAVEMLDRMKQIEGIFTSHTASLKGTLRIGASTTIGNYLMPRYITKFKALHPDVDIFLEVANTEKIDQELLKFNLDIGFIEGICHSKLLNIKQWEKDELVIFASPKHPLANKGTLNKNTIEQAQWILRETGSGTREILEKHLQPKNILLELGSTEAIKLAVQEGVGISCLSRSTCQQEFQSKKLVRLDVKNFAISRDFLQLTHKEKYPSDVVEVFKALVNKKH